MFFSLECLVGFFVFAAKLIFDIVLRGSGNRPDHGFCHQLGWGSVAAKITANVWEIVQLSNLVTPLLYNEVGQKLCLLIGIDKDTVYRQNKRNRSELKRL